MNDLTEQLNQGVSRRSFVRRAAIGASLLPLSGFFASAASSPGQSAGVTAGDIAILKFLAAAELVETDLWQQYCELASGNTNYRAALQDIDPAIVSYICDDRDNELSHANFINAYLRSIGQQPVNLDPFRTLPSSSAQGADHDRGRLTNLTDLTVDTSWYHRYRSPENPDFGDTFPQVAIIQNQPTIPLGDGEDAGDIKVIAESAAFHFCAIEQGGASLYDSFLTKVTNLDVLQIVASIGPVEFYQFGTFHASLEGITQASSANSEAGDKNNTQIPDLRSRPELARATLPEPCDFLSESLPLCSVLRPRTTPKAGAVAAATALVKSGLFKGQSPAFLNAVVALATAADAAMRSC